MAIEITNLPQKTKEVSWLRILSSVCIILLIILFLGYLALFFLEKGLEQRLEEAEKALIKTADELTIEKEALGYKEKIENFSVLLSSHQLPSKIFAFFEKFSHPQVWFFRFKFESAKGLVTVSGRAENLQALGQQLTLFKEQPVLKNINLTEVLIGKQGGIEFSLQLAFDPQIFKK